MTDQQSIARFIVLRSQGWSFNRIAAELAVSKPTLIKWSRQYKIEVRNLRATETEALIETVFGTRLERWQRLAAQLKKIEDEIDRRKVGEIPAPRLHDIAARLRAEIRDVAAAHPSPFQLAERSDVIPHSERMIYSTEWNA